ncbi:hypothetical protein MAPG_03030 [Magnaporthiopsis poae ATCC 64411]|uniref:Uncharacterized protein n=1 Tax=Magnaporthiopsis poae (strain ATCC 64411 / 73-15) TaxID=644358 RepID=A0A0C4DSY4_MAGP6|nr:hypothetical protein MAPG_03030 [Magnaporthiopsis poae ATCC 64411]
MNKLTHEEMAEAGNFMGSSQQTCDRGQRGHQVPRSATQEASRPVVQGDDHPGTHRAARGNLPRGGAPTQSPSAHRNASHGAVEKSTTGRGYATAAGTSLLKQRIEEIAARYLAFLNAEPATPAAATSPTAEEDANLPPPVAEDYQSAGGAAGAGVRAGVSRRRAERGRDACTCSGLKKAKGLADSRFAGPVAAPVAGQSRFTGVCPVHDVWEGI